MARSGKGVPGQSQLRIIGGRWRGRKLTFIPAEGLRPTTDRIRETLFNWLAPYIDGARCADLFTGSGALGLEALSRGAAYCDFVDTSGATLAQVSTHLATLDAISGGQCHTSTALEFLRARHEPYDLVFIDPPFGQDLVDITCALLAEKNVLAKGALAYGETAANEPTPNTPPSWALHRERSSGGVAYRLFTID
jgi:16S rRNA (guanine966-N2)-methyltransferase